MSFTADWHFTVESVVVACGRLPRSGCPRRPHHVIDSDHGHDAFLVEPEHVGPPLRDFLVEGVGGRAVSDDGGGGGVLRAARAGPRAGSREPF